MKGLIRMLTMFGPMLFRMFKKYQNKNAAKEQALQNHEPQSNREEEVIHRNMEGRERMN